MLVLVLSLGGLAGAASAQSACSESDSSVQMRMLLEKTIFKVDVLTLTVRLDGAAAHRLAELAGGRELTEAVSDSVARTATDATCGQARLDFVRNVSLGRFLDAIRESSRAALEADLIEHETFRLIDESLPEWYAFLEGRGVRDGDRMSYRIRGDTLNIRYLSSSGELLLDQTDVSAARRRSVLAGYFAPGSDFRRGLIRSLFRDEGAGGGEARPRGSGSGRLLPAPLQL